LFVGLIWAINKRFPETNLPLMQGVASLSPFGWPCFVLQCWLKSCYTLLGFSAR
jgi:hypothetical protein